MAMLCAVVAVMFLSIVPVRTEAAGRCAHRNLEYVAAVEATCDEDGHRDYQVCKSCKAMIIEGKVVTEADVTVKAQGHEANGKWESDENGHYQWCMHDCNTKLKEGEHTYGECKSASAEMHEHFCTECEYRELLPHVDEDHDCVCDDCGRNLAHKLVRHEDAEATCTEDGVKWHYECENCHKLFWDAGCKNEASAEDVVIPALGHEGNGKWETEEDGCHYQWCWRNCGTKVMQEDHVAGEWAGDATGHWRLCTVCEKVLESSAEHDYECVYATEGYHQYVCKVCGYKSDGERHVDEDNDCKCDKCDADMPHNKENLTKVERVEPTCTEEGNKGYLKCEHCGKVFNLVGTEITEEDIVISATGHDWAYDGMMYGKHFAVCNSCSARELIDHEDTDGDCKCDLPNCDVLVHSHRLVFHAEVPATCDEDGTEGYYTYQDCGKMFDLYQNPIKEPKVIKATGHDMSDEWVPGENGQHVRKCANCDYCEAEDHVFKNGDVHCIVCGAEEDLTHVEAKAATCTEQGNVEYWTSWVTGKKYADEAGTRELEDVIVPATGHELTGLVDNGDGTHSQHCQNPGCQYEEGSGIHKAAENGCYCADCGGAMKGHELTLVNAVAATCEKAGTEAYFQCSCGAKYDLEGQSIQAPKAIAKLAHTTDGKVYKDTKEGKHYTECTTCGKKFYEEHVMVVQDPMKGNYHQYVCECGELEVEQHYDEDGDGFCDVCDHSLSSTSVTVEQHDSVTVTTGDASTINKNYSWWRNWLEALFPSNTGGTVASAKKTEEISEASSQTTAEKSQTAAPAASGANQNTNQNAAVSSGSATGETVVNSNALTQFVNWFLSLFGF